MPPSAWAGWICFESEVEVEAAKDELYRTAGLSSELPSCHVRCTPAVEEKDFDVMYSIDGVH
jgi:hypothetical protein